MGMSVRAITIASLCMALLALSASAATNWFTGNTLKSVWRLTTTRCSSNGPCEIVARTTVKSFIYIGVEGNVFDYSSGDKGDMAHIGAEIGNKAHMHKWLLQGNRLILRTVLYGTQDSPGDAVSDWTYTALGGGKCSVSVKSVKPGFTLRQDVALESCEILPGHVER